MAEKFEKTRLDRGIKAVYLGIPNFSTTLMKIVLLFAFLIGSLSAAPMSFMERRFLRFDVNNDGKLDSIEWLQTQPASSSLVQAQFRFNYADADENGGVDRVEYLASRGGRMGGRPSKQETFDLADVDEDNHLDPEEYATTVGQNQSWQRLLRTFDRLDRDDDSLLSEYEFGIRIRPVFGGFYGWAFFQRPGVWAL
ncbi:EF-hand domain-containing protein [Haloferula sargassicola]|uniref:EF-hand domain-containing protein n=1 Tax=Haloferula sargassicola TaxID=490096 RepID=A0ABP9US63_9BACT